MLLEQAQLFDQEQQPDSEQQFKLANLQHQPLEKQVNLEQPVNQEQPNKVPHQDLALTIHHTVEFEFK